MLLCLVALFLAPFLSPLLSLCYAEARLFCRPCVVCCSYHSCFVVCVPTALCKQRAAALYLGRAFSFCTRAPLFYACI